VSGHYHAITALTSYNHHCRDNENEILLLDDGCGVVEEFDMRRGATVKTIECKIVILCTENDDFVCLVYKL